jgi:hypothetical protein
VRRATTPWNGSSVGKRGRPRKERDGKKKVGCVWPAEMRPDGTCAHEPVEGLALCPGHAKVLLQRAGKTCAWPNCEQTALFKPMCTYHTKVGLGLLDPYTT